jgi:integrase
MKAEGNRLHLLCTIQGMLGLRVGDVLRLKWEDFSNTELLLSESKTGKQRRLIVNDGLRNAVWDEFSKKTFRKKSEYIFLNKYRTGPISVEYVNRELKKLFKKYQVEADQVSSHIFRKSFAYKILEDHDFSDKGIFLVSRLLNHSTIAMTMRYLLLDQKEADTVYENLKLI